MLRILKLAPFHDLIWINRPPFPGGEGLADDLAEARCHSDSIMSPETPLF